MKKNFFIGLFVSCMVIVGCTGGGDSYSSTNSYKDFSSGNEDSLGISSSASDSSPESTSDSSTSITNLSNSAQDSIIDKEMLIYRCEATIDTLDYNSSVTSFKSLLQDLGGFVEQENYSDGAGYYDYIVDESQKQQRYTATVRVPSAKYDTLINSLGDLGDVRSKESSVENVSQEYKDAGVRMEILQAKEKAYVKMLEKSSNTQEMLQIESYLTEVQVQIEQLKSRMMTIEADVAYSYLNISINEVSHYKDKPKTNDTFLKRLRNTLVETVQNFAEFLEWLLFLLIHLFPYAILFSLVFIIVRKCCKVYRKKHPPKPRQQRLYHAPDYVHGSAKEKQDSSDPDSK